VPPLANRPPEPASRFEFTSNQGIPKLDPPPLARGRRLRHAGMWCAEGLREHVWISVGYFLCIPADTPHLPYNASGTKPCVGVVARTDPNEEQTLTPIDIADPRIAPRE
jgi:hypothetical protein